MGCPICMEDTQAFRLQHGRKACYFDCHRQFLPHDHPYRRNKRSFTKNRQERKIARPRLTGDEIRRRVEQYGTAVEEPLTYPPGYGNVHKWTKKSIFWDLSYWNTHLIRHNLDVMHIEKNVFNNIFNTVMDIKGKTKDNLNARKDLKNICNRPELEVDERRPNAMPKAACVDNANLRVHGMKSHDCHIFMQKLTSVAFRELLPEFVWSALTEVSLLFQVLCSTTLDVKKVQELEENIAIIMCNLEKIFPPVFFDSMKHLIVHLPYGARVGGPVQYRWMYPFERFLRDLKKKVKNKAHAEALICEAYIVQEIVWFTSHYFESHITCKRHRPSRNDELTQNNNRVTRDIFNHPGRTSGVSTKRYALGQERHVMETINTANCATSGPSFKTYRITEPIGDSMQFTTSSAAAPPTAPPRARTYISGDDILAYRWDRPDKEVRRFFNKSAGKWLSKKFNEARTMNKQPIWIANDVWASLQEYWGTDEFKKKSMQNKANRLANPAIANTVCCGGSSSMGEHKRKLEAQLGRPHKRMEVFVSCYKKKNDDS
ncbi:UNVERIFIED_CONTAM: hypothetical protein Slati_2772800 [Sesamum latifolium]|uniref:DUF4218 domain-containing protein n=1 Tax=Sesamum latifolium TaxID=2727402 RepID=A0AAW2W2P1_9LAMI